MCRASALKHSSRNRNRPFRGTMGLKHEITRYSKHYGSPRPHPRHANSSNSQRVKVLCYCNLVGVYRGCQAVRLNLATNHSIWPLFSTPINKIRPLFLLFILSKISISDPVYASKCLQHAKDLFDFAQTYQGSYSDHIETGERYQVRLSSVLESDQYFDKFGDRIFGFRASKKSLGLLEIVLVELVHVM